MAQYEPKNLQRVNSFFASILKQQFKILSCILQLKVCCCALCFSQIFENSLSGLVDECYDYDYIYYIYIYQISKTVFHYTLHN